MSIAFHKTSIMATPFLALSGLALALLLVLGDDAARAQSRPVLDPSHPIIGTLESDPAHMAALTAAGADAVVVGISWDRCETKEGEFDAKYLQSLKEKIAAFRAGGKRIVLDLGVQYPPSWIFDFPSSHFVNQYGEPFVPARGSGDCGVNLVFSGLMRDKFTAYVQHLFHELGRDFFAVRLGGGRYGELGYPTNKIQDHANCYWAFDPIAQGQVVGLPEGVKACPVPRWIPGTPSPNHSSARQFLAWYMASMQNYHDWQISVLRTDFSGPLFMLYPSTGGLRLGQLDAAIDDDCNGSTGPEKTGEVGRGYDMARFVAGITDPRVVVYSTWIDGFDFCDDRSIDSARWSPGHYLASLAEAHQPPLLVGGENTGRPDDLANMQLTFRRVGENHLCVLFWAFEPTLFDHKEKHATIEDFAACSAAARRN
jgi:hypothetical protein